LVDMPGGAFVCTYVGNLYTAEESNSIGKNFGDEYFAELDLVENVEGHKDGWESDVIEPGEESDKEESKVEESEEVKSSVDDAEDEAGEGTTKKRRSSRLAVVQQEKKQKKLEDSKKGRMVSARKLFGKNEEAYIMDAKVIGNLGRYMNHSCRPNVFVQNVFVDSHDLRFPWIAFFTTTYVKAGTELVWDYNYEVGSVQGKRIDCCCGEAECRGRLL